MKKFSRSCSLRASLLCKNSFSTAAVQKDTVRAPVFKGIVTPMRTVPESIKHPDYAFTGRPKDAPK